MTNNSEFPAVDEQTLKKSIKKKKNTGEKKKKN